MSEKELIDLQNSDSSRKTLLWKLYWKNKIPNKKDFLKTLEKLDFTERVKSKLKQLWWEKHDDLLEVADRFLTIKKNRCYWY
jgi:DNA-directed RNA polymerase alpha subunit